MVPLDGCACMFKRSQTTQNKGLISHGTAQFFYFGGGSWISVKISLVQVAQSVECPLQGGHGFDPGP